MTRRATLRTGLGKIRPHTSAVFEEVAARWPIFFAWGIGGSGEHEEGRALDFMTYADGTVSKPGPIRVEVGEEIAAYLWANRTRLGVWYVIHRQRIISVRDNSYGKTGKWYRMPDRGDPTANHMDHVHVSLLEAPPTYRPQSTPKPPAQEVHDVALTEDDAYTLWTARKWREYEDENGNKKRDARTPADVLYATNENTVETQNAVAALSQKVEALTDQIAALAQIVTKGGTRG